ncbi:hypothetical protein BKA70DRAFT_1398049 [Coprinopsis sp. MPI-PUGE-AT-0042]|nr:hypothetical protein BKA70DRAFT_1398049 [Coprinopsis sp. MPI-PUGE-AT-0042]
MSSSNSDVEATLPPPQEWSITEVTLTMPTSNFKRLKTRPRAVSGDPTPSPPFTSIRDPFNLDFKCIEAGLLSSTQLRSREDVLRGLLTNPNEVEILSEAGLELAWSKVSHFIPESIFGWRNAFGSGYRRAKMFANSFIWWLRPCGRLRGVVGWEENTLLGDDQDDQDVDVDVNEFFRRVEVSHEEGFTVTGKVDYIIWPLKRDTSDEQAEEYRSIGYIEDALLESIKLDTKDVGLLMINVHSIRDESWKGMKDHVPKVVMNAYLCMSKANRKIMPWILTNGLLWFFGVVKRGEGDKLNTFGYFGVEPIDYKKLEPRHNKVAVAIIYRMLMVWAYGDPELLFQAFIARDGDKGVA